MIQIEHEITINKPLEEVFAFAANPENNPQWQEGLEAVKVARVPPQVGDSYSEVRKFLGREMETTLEFATYEPNRRVVTRSVDGPVSFQAESSFAAVDGATQLHTRIEAEAGGFFKLAEGAVAKQLQKTVQESSQRLKDLLENR